MPLYQQSYQFFAAMSAVKFSIPGGKGARGQVAGQLLNEQAGSATDFQQVIARLRGHHPGSPGKPFVCIAT
jgi:hypothetical protein